MRGSLWVELAVFLSVSFGGMFVIAFFLRRLGGFKRVVVDGRVVSFPASPYVAALISLAMFIPALAALAVSMVSGENFFDYGLRRLGSPLYWLFALAYPLALVVLSALTVYVVDPGRVRLAAVPRVLGKFSALPLADVRLGRFASLCLVVAAPFFNLFFALGEEVGWRGFLFAKLSGEAGLVVASLVVGAVWGLWHAPLILLGYNYPHHSDWLGVAVFTLLCSLMGVYFSWLAVGSGSVLPVALAHGAFNAYAQVALFVVRVEDEIYGAPFGLASLPAYLLLAFVAAWAIGVV